MCCDIHWCSELCFCKGLLQFFLVDIKGILNKIERLRCDIERHNLRFWQELQGNNEFFTNCRVFRSRLQLEERIFVYVAHARNWRENSASRCPLLPTRSVYLWFPEPL